MCNGRENGEGVIAVAVDKERGSQYALKWAVDNLYPRSKLIKLVHVVQRSPLPPSNSGNSEIATQQESDGRGMEVLLPYRCFCTRRQVQFECVILHDLDVAKALIDYVSLGGVDKLILGTFPRNGFSRIFKNSDISSSVLKWASNYCNVYIINKGKVSAMRPASRSAQVNPAVERTQPTFVQNVNHHTDPDILYEELSVVENDNSLMGSGRLSTDSNYFSFYEHLESELGGSSSDIFNLENGNYEPLFSSSKTVNMNSTKDFPFNERPSFSLDDMEGELRRHKVELKEAMDLYHAACIEARVSKQKLSELQDWNVKQEQRLKEVESENARCKAAIEATQRMTAEGVENRVLKAEIRAILEADERTKVLDALRHSHTVIRYQTLFQTLVVLFLSYFYISSFK
ncbi:U-box domain-containing protein 35 [Abrus precatorius]|uniref:RING-type E3 ubiquitin transferase n=1 Tax=Abrus precatorius TaxID=3816 RepID=A0A8B8KJU6_ABRPR|nr:U-box domain-containing protein 35 [Abrus precatorius]